MLEGQAPKVRWVPNPDGRRRTLAEAIEIARKFGVVIPDDVIFFVDDFDLLDDATTARGPSVKPRPWDHCVAWHELLTKDGKVPFIIRADILDSDEAFVAVLVHEMYELEQLRRRCQVSNATLAA